MEIDTFPDDVDIARLFTPKTDSKDEEGLPGVCSVDELPPLLFRWSNFDSQGLNSRKGFLAGLFQKDEKTGIDVDKLTRKQYLQFFKSHVTKAMISSPFISASRLPLTPIHRALWNKQGATVAIIDTSEINTLVVKASNLVLLTETETPHWKGYGEYLIWGKIPQAAISCMFKITHLETIASEFSDINEFLQLDLIKSHSFCGASLYRELAQKLKTGANHCVTLERMATLLNVPPKHVGLVAERFEEAWVSNRFGYLDQVAEDRAQDIDISNMEIGPREPFNYKRVSASDASTYAPSRSDLDHSSESEDPYQETGSASPEAPARRYDTPSPPFSTQDSIDDDEPWRWGQIFEEEEMMQDERGPLNVQLFTPSTNRAQQTAEIMLISPIPIDFERDISWPPSENYA
ncbi:hypothetical protein N7520_005009 [Penicillium odoratum]|uniref:uncharacterized protein n=1 Tax=Penicillium odoratum TaxID=1167516 RepID=UPI0025474613|nr:uncharacterized protein N7520_005009 [Penicillium odoratum]KAJ5765450.1 hypothetical protein N7520_005009 [Penicillium odoratum]